MNLNQIKNVYFIGIGGIGMSALARYFHNIGKTVYGYDKTETELTKTLGKLGITIHYNDDINQIPKDFHPENSLIVTTPAIKNLSEWEYFKERNFEIKKRAEVLGTITKDTYCFAVAGTHGKTTTSSILAHILYQSGVDVTGFLGGIVEGYNSNLIGSGKTVTVVEADEFDRSFLHLHPNIACITSMDADHLDIYGDKSAIEASFIEFANKIEDKSKLFITSALPIDGVVCDIINDKTISTINSVPPSGVRALFQAINIRIENGNYIFNVQTPTETIQNIAFSLPGKHNLMNALMAFAMAKTYGIFNQNIIQALANFKGIQRRFSYQIKTDNLVFIDDYAHHPTEINAVYQAVTELYPTQKTLAVFQPHLYSRTQDFADDFAKALSQFHEVILLDIYPARELPIAGVTSTWLIGKMTNNNVKLVQKTDLITNILQTAATIILTIGAGDIGAMVNDIKENLLKK
jgi:UDP-N-acetylmuramate--alanine ligase